MIKLSRLVLEDLKLNAYEKSLALSGLSSDSRSIKKGYLFAAISNDSNLYVEDAINKGAIIILTNNEFSQNYNNLTDTVVLNHPNPRELYGKICARFYKLKFD